MKNYLNLLQQSVLFSGLNISEIESVLHCLGVNVMDYRKNQYIASTDEVIENIGLVLSGQVHIIQDDFMGNRNIISKVQPPQIFAESFACTPGAHLYVSIVADVPTKILFLNVKRVLNTCSSSCSFHNAVIRNLLSDIASKNIQLNEKLIHMAQRTTREKLLSYLSSESSKNNTPIFDIPYNRQQLADYLSVDRSAMSNELCKMRDEGLLKFNKNHFELT